MFTEMKSAGLSSICQGTNGLNGSAFRAILSTFGPVLAPGVGDPVPVPVCVQAARTSAPMRAGTTGHQVFRLNMSLSPPAKKLTIECACRGHDRARTGRVREDLPSAHVAAARPSRIIAPVEEAARTVTRGPAYL